MPSDPILHFRVTPEQKAEIKSLAKAAGYSKLSPYLRDRALGVEAAWPRDEVRKKVREAARPIPSATVIESPLGPVATAEQPGMKGDTGPLGRYGPDGGPPTPDSDESHDQFITRRSRQLFGTGMIRKQARAQAEREWDEAHPEPEDAA